MSQRDVLNPLPGWDPQLGDSMNPDYGFTRKRAVTRALTKAVGGVPYTRELGNTGHTFVLSWLGRTYPCVQKLRWFYEQFEDGFFTVIDHDGAGRHYVGRFTTEVIAIETANNKWDVQQLQFEEIPESPMLQYPNDWVHDAVDLFTLNDFGDQKLCLSGTWALAAQNFAGIERTVATDNGTVGDWAQYEYRGYGFQVWCLVGAGQGTATVLLDGTQVATVNLAGPAAALQPQMVFEMTDVPLDLHRVQLTVATAAPCTWYKLRVMR